MVLKLLLFYVTMVVMSFLSVCKIVEMMARRPRLANDTYKIILKTSVCLPWLWCLNLVLWFKYKQSKVSSFVDFIDKHKSKFNKFDGLMKK